MLPEHTQTWGAVESNSGISTMPFKQRFGPASMILVVGFIVGVGLRFSIDDAAERDLANYVRSGLHGSGVAFAAWIVQGFFAAKAHSPIGDALGDVGAPALHEVLRQTPCVAGTAVLVRSSRACRKVGVDQSEQPVESRLVAAMRRGREQK
jgi:hypothetical protein